MKAWESGDRSANVANCHFSVTPFFCLLELLDEAIRARRM
jgi:hypothetical protein